MKDGNGNRTDEQAEVSRHELYERYVDCYLQLCPEVRPCRDSWLLERAARYLRRRPDPEPGGTFTAFPLYEAVSHRWSTLTSDCCQHLAAVIRAAEQLETICVNLFLQPWRREIRRLKTFTGPFVYRLQPVLSASTIQSVLASIGYLPHAGAESEYRLSEEANPDRAMLLGFELLLARVECGYLLELLEKDQLGPQELLEVLQRKLGPTKLEEPTEKKTPVGRKEEEKDKKKEEVPLDLDTRPAVKPQPKPRPRHLIGIDQSIVEMQMTYPDLAFRGRPLLRDKPHRANSHKSSSTDVHPSSTNNCSDGSEAAELPNRGCPKDTRAAELPNRGCPKDTGAAELRNRGCPKDTRAAELPNRGCPKDTGAAELRNRGCPKDTGAAELPNRGCPKDTGAAELPNRGCPKDTGAAELPNRGCPKDTGAAELPNRGCPKDTAAAAATLGRKNDVIKADAVFADGGRDGGCNDTGSSSNGDRGRAADELSGPRAISLHLTLRAGSTAEPSLKPGEPRATAEPRPTAEPRARTQQHAGADLQNNGAPHPKLPSLSSMEEVQELRELAERMGQIPAQEAGEEAQRKDENRRKERRRKERKTSTEGDAEEQKLREKPGPGPTPSRTIRRRAGSSRADPATAAERQRSPPTVGPAGCRSCKGGDGSGRQDGHRAITPEAGRGDDEQLALSFVLVEHQEK